MRLPRGFKRHGTTPCFAAQMPADRELHLILNNYAAHKHAKVKAGLAKHPLCHLHFTPTSTS
jgi:hypothetical protein